MGFSVEPHVPVSEAPWPVINKQPSFWAAFGNMKFGDYVFFVTMTAVGSAYGFAVGARAREPSRRQPAPPQCARARTVAPVCAPRRGTPP